MARSVSFAPAAVTAAVDLFEVYQSSTPSTTKVLGLHLGQTTDLGDASEEILPYVFRTGYLTSGASGGTAVVGPLGSADADSGSVEVLNTSVASGGTYLVHEGYIRGFNIRAGEDVWFPEGTEPFCGGFIDGSDADFGRLVVRLLAAPADSLTMFGSLIFKGEFYY